MFTKEEYVEWRNSRVTKTIVKILAENRQSRLEDVGEGKAIGVDLEREIGRTQGIKDAVNAMLNMNGELTDLILEEKADDKENV